MTRHPAPYVAMVKSDLATTLATLHEMSAQDAETYWQRERQIVGSGMAMSLATYTDWITDLLGFSPFRACATTRDQATALALALAIVGETL